MIEGLSEFVVSKRETLKEMTRGLSRLDELNGMHSSAQKRVDDIESEAAAIREKVAAVSDGIELGVFRPMFGEAKVG